MKARVAGCWLLAVLAALAQTPAFEVASVKASTPDATRMNIQRDPGGGIVLTNVNLQTLVSMAYNVQSFQLVGGPPWLRSRRFDVVAKAPSGTAKNQTWVMLQSLLADRFQLAIHRETRELPVFELVVAKGGLKIQPANRAPGPADDFIQNFPGRMKALMVSMAGLALTLSGTLGRQVIDRTNLDGRYDFQLEFAPENTTDSDRSSIYTALQEQLGLKLETSKGPVQMIVIDHAELPAAN
jgi:bla regulator protein blaR1